MMMEPGKELEKMNLRAEFAESGNPRSQMEVR